MILGQKSLSSKHSLPQAYCILCGVELDVCTRTGLKLFERDYVTSYMPEVHTVYIVESV